MADSHFIRIPPDSTGKRMKAVYHPESDVYTQGTSLVSGDDDHNVQLVDSRGAAYVRYTNGVPEFDSFNRMVTSREVNLLSLDFTQGSFADDVIWRNTQGTGDISIESNGPVVLSTGTTLNDSAVLQTHEYFKYSAGFSTSFIFTMICGDSGKAGVVRRVGSFDDDNGLYFQVDENGLSAVIRSASLGTEIVTPLAEFTGIKQAPDFDVTKNNIYWIDYQWLGAGNVKFGTYVSGRKVVLHEVDNYNKYSVPYIQSGNLPFRAEQTNLAAAPSGSELRITCIGVYSGIIDSTYRIPRIQSTDSITQITSDNPITVIAFRSTELHGIDGKVNRRPCRLSTAEFALVGEPEADGSSQIVKLTVYGTTDAQITDGVWENISSSDTASAPGLIEYNTSFTFDTSLHKPVLQQLLRKGDTTSYAQQSIESRIGEIRRLADSSFSKCFIVVVERLSGVSPATLHGVYNWQQGS